MSHRIRHLLTLLGLALVTVGPTFGQGQDENLVVNPAFGNSPDPVTSSRGAKLGGGATLLRLDAGSRDITGWTVARGTVWLGGVPWEPNRFVVLGEDGLLTQTISSVPGKDSSWPGAGADPGAGFPGCEGAGLGSQAPAGGAPWQSHRPVGDGSRWLRESAQLFISWQQGVHLPLTWGTRVGKSVSAR